MSLFSFWLEIVEQNDEAVDRMAGCSLGKDYQVRKMHQLQCGSKYLVFCGFVNCPFVYSFLNLAASMRWRSSLCSWRLVLCWSSVTWCTRSLRWRVNVSRVNNLVTLMQSCGRRLEKPNNRRLVNRNSQTGTTTFLRLVCDVSAVSRKMYTTIQRRQLAHKRGGSPVVQLCPAHSSKKFFRNISKTRWLFSVSVFLFRPTVYMHQLSVETFERLILKSEPGVRAIIILVDHESRDKLLQTFATTILPYSRWVTVEVVLRENSPRVRDLGLFRSKLQRNCRKRHALCGRILILMAIWLRRLALHLLFRSAAFTFSFLQLEHYLGWYRHLLEETLDFKRDLGKINLKNCVGTVLAINGPRK